MGLQAVATTGIYCRATCTARPRPENVRPVRNQVEAMAAGYRPCLLCRPDRLPGLGLEQPVSEVAHALRLIADGFLDTATTEALAQRIGYSSRQLVRLFHQHVGASPDFVARARRAHLARRLLDETDLTVTHVAFAAGFSSVRQMNRVMRDLFGFTPSHLRAKRRSADPLEPLDGGLRLRVPYDGPLATDDALEHLRARATPGVETVADGYLRTINTCGYPGVLQVQSRGPGELCATLHLATFGSIMEVVTRVRSLFALDADPGPARRKLLKDPTLRPLLLRHRGLRMPGAYDRFETAVRIIVGQQVSVAGATTVMGQLAERYGEPIATPLPAGLTRLFPSPAALAGARPDELAMPRARARALIGFANAVAAGDIDLARVASLEDTVTTLQELPGIGPWTAHLIAARVMGHQDAFPASDLGLRRAVATLRGDSTLPSARDMEQLADAWRPYRAVAAAHLWMATT